MSKNLDKNKDSYGISQVQINKAKKLDKQHLKEITAFNKNILLKTLTNLIPYEKKVVKQLNLKVKGNKFVQVLIKQKMDKKRLVHYVINYLNNFMMMVLMDHLQ